MNDSAQKIAMNNKVFILTSTLLIVSCSQKELYDATQDNRLRHCQEQAKTQEHYSQCRQTYSKSYAEYQEQRPK